MPSIPIHLSSCSPINVITGFCIYDPIFQWIQESIWTKDLVRVFHVKKNFRYLVVTWRGKSKKYHV